MERSNLEAIIRDEFAMTFVSTVLHLFGIEQPATETQVLSAVRVFEEYKSDAAFTQTSSHLSDPRWMEGETVETRAATLAYLFVEYREICLPGLALAGVPATLVQTVAH